MPGPVSIAFTNRGKYPSTVAPNHARGQDGSVTLTIFCSKCRSGSVRTLTDFEVASIEKGATIRIRCPTPGCDGVDFEAHPGTPQKLKDGIVAEVPPGGSLVATANCPKCGEVVQVRFPIGLSNPGKVRDAPQTCSKGHTWTLKVSLYDKPPT
jgi:hypothetical protein